MKLYPMRVRVPKKSFIVGKLGVERWKSRLVRVSRRNVWRTQLTTRESQGICVGLDRRMRV
jgi:hypothetical protein